MKLAKSKRRRIENNPIDMSESHRLTNTPDLLYILCNKSM